MVFRTVILFFSRKNVKYFNVSANVKMILLNSPVLNIDHAPCIDVGLKW